MTKNKCYILYEFSIFLILLTISDKSVARVKIEMRCVSHVQFPFIGFGHPSLNIQSCIRRPLCCTFKCKSLRSPKKTIFGGQKEFKKFLIKKVLCIFLVQTLWCFHEKHEKKQPQKLVIIAPNFIFSTGMAAQTAQKQKFRTTISP